MKNLSDFSQRLYGRRLLLTALFILCLTLVPHLVWLDVRAGWYPCKRYLMGLPFLILLALPSLLPGRAGKGWLVLVFLIIVPLSTAMALHLGVLHSNINEEMLFALMETNKGEAGEAIAAYCGPKTMLIVLAGLGMPLMALIPLLRMPFKTYRKSLFGALLLGVGLL